MFGDVSYSVKANTMQFKVMSKMCALDIERLKSHIHILMLYTQER